MLGAIIGDMVGSIYEFDPIKSKDFNIYNEKMHMTDDSLLTIAVSKVLINHYPIRNDEKSLNDIKQDLIKEFVNTWNENPKAGWGNSFNHWCYKASIGGKPLPYNSCGNGAGMRISPVAWIAKDESELKILSKTVTEITHNHPEGIKGAEAIALCIYLALEHYSKEAIKERMINEYYPEIANYDFDELVKNYQFSELCQESVPQAIYCFLTSNSLEDAIRNCVAIGGDCDTTGAMCGAIAEAFYKKDNFSKFEKTFLDTMIDDKYKDVIYNFYEIAKKRRILWQ